MFKLFKRVAGLFVATVLLTGSLSACAGKYT